MKKVITLLAIAAFSLWACQKESADNNNIDAEKQEASVSIQGDIPDEIVCEVSETPTKTQYAGNTTFGWTQYDRIKMPARNGATVGSYSFRTTAPSGSTTATFLKTSGTAYDVNEFDGESGYVNMGYLVYPISIFGDEACESYPVVNLPSTLSYDSASPLNSVMDSNGNWQARGIPVPMIGRKVGDTYKFATAVGFLKMTISNVPAHLSAITLVSTTNCISGKFALSHSATNYYGSDVAIAEVMTSTTGYNSEGTKDLTLSISSLTEGATYDFFFPIPVGTYDANTLSLKIKTQDGDNVKVISKKIAKEVTIARNEILSIPELPLSTPNYSVSISASGSNCPNLRYINTGAASRYLRFCVRSSSEHNLSKYVNGMKFTDIPTDKTYGLLGATNADGSSLTGTGDYYLHYMILNTNSDLSDLSLSSLHDNRIIEFGTIPFSYNQALSDVLGTYVRLENTNMIANWATNSYENNITIVFEEIDGNDTNAPTGTNLKMTRIGTVLGVAYGTYDGINTISFEKAQIFNTFDPVEVNSVTYDRNSFLGLTGMTWYDPSFTIVRNGTLTTNQTYLVLRNTNEALWTSGNHTEGRQSPYGGGKWTGYVNSQDVPFTLSKQQ